MRVAFHTLGCKVNQYESEALKGQFAKLGWDIVNENDIAEAYIINTCTVTSLADKKSRQYIRRMKKNNPESVVVVTGCYAQVSQDEVEKIEGVNIIVGNNNKNNIPKMVVDYIYEKNKNIVSLITPTKDIVDFEEWGSTTFAEDKTRAFIKIQEGCNRYCSYCIIPYARGGLRSRRVEDILKEANDLLKKGFKELVLTGINTALYDDLENLIENINNIDGDFRIRLSSLEPTVINKEYVKKILRFEKLCHHLHLSIQSANDKVLKAMNRRYSVDEYKEIVNILREFDEVYGITTDIIVGFPSENEEDFENSLDNIKDIGFCRIHSFKYSKREGTPAANMEEQVSEYDKKKRSNRLIELGNLLSEEFVKKNLGRKNRVLFEEKSVVDGYITGYTDNYIKAYLKSEDISVIGNLIDVRICDSFLDGAIVEPVKN